jgi:hypothetical protein
MPSFTKVSVLAGLAVAFAGCLGAAGEGEDGGTSSSSSSGSNSSSSSGGANSSSGESNSSSSGSSSSGSAGKCPNCGNGLICCASGELAGTCVTQFECDDSGTTGTSSSSGQGNSSSGSVTVGSSSGTGSKGNSSGSASQGNSSGSNGSITSIGSTSSSGGSQSSSSGGSSSGSLLGTTCAVAQNGQPDSCSPAGLACIGVSVVSTTGTCQLPTNGYACEPSVGCATGYSCVGSTGQTYCYQDCTTTNDCSAAYETCQSEGNGTSLCIYESCTNFYGLCNVIGTNDGFCVPFSNPPQADYGLCIAGAPVDAGVPSSCTTFGRGGGLCPVGMFCYTDYETTGTQCQPFCGAIPISGTTSPSCSGGEFCVQDYGSLFGSCAPTCPVPDVASNCPAQENCLVTGQALPDGGQAFTCEP